MVGSGTEHLLAQRGDLGWVGGHMVGFGLVPGAVLDAGSGVVGLPDAADAAAATVGGPLPGGGPVDAWSGGPLAKRVECGDGVVAGLGEQCRCALVTSSHCGDDGGDGSGGKVRRSAKRKPKPKFVVEVDGKFVVVDSQAEADQVIRPKTAVPIIDPPETLAEDISEDEQQAALIKAQNDAKVMEMIEQMQRDDEDDVEMLLLSL